MFASIRISLPELAARLCRAQLAPLADAHAAAFTLASSHVLRHGGGEYGGAAT